MTVSMLLTTVLPTFPSLICLRPDLYWRGGITTTWLPTIMFKRRFPLHPMSVACSNKKTLIRKYQFKLIHSHGLHSAGSHWLSQELKQLYSHVLSGFGSKVQNFPIKILLTGKGSAQNVSRICWLIKRSYMGSTWLYNRQQHAEIDVFWHLGKISPFSPHKIAFPNYADQHSTTCNCTILENMYHCTKFLVSVNVII